MGHELKWPNHLVQGQLYLPLYLLLTLRNLFDSLQSPRFHPVSFVKNITNCSMLAMEYVRVYKAADRSRIGRRLKMIEWGVNTK